MPEAGEATDCWFDEPDPADRRSWAIPPGHGTYRGLDLELLDPADEGELMFLIEALHTESEDAIRSDEEMITGGEPFSPRVHIAMHQVVASQLLADDPPETWQSVQRLSALGYDWHNIMHMIAAVVSDDLYRAVPRRTLVAYERTTRGTPELDIPRGHPNIAEFPAGRPVPGRPSIRSVWQARSDAWHWAPGRVCAADLRWRECGACYLPFCECQALLSPVGVVG